MKGGDERGSTLPPHLIVKHEEVVIKCQHDSADQHTLVQDLVLSKVCRIAGRTFTVVLTMEQTAHVLSPRQPEETSDTYRARTLCPSASMGSILGQSQQPWSGPFAIQCTGAEEKGEAVEEDG